MPISGKVDSPTAGKHKTLSPQHKHYETQPHCLAFTHGGDALGPPHYKHKAPWSAPHAQHDTAALWVEEEHCGNLNRSHSWAPGPTQAHQSPKQQDLPCSHLTVQWLTDKSGQGQASAWRVVMKALLQPSGKSVWAEEVKWHGTGGPGSMPTPVSTRLPTVLVHRLPEAPYQVVHAHLRGGEVVEQLRVLRDGALQGRGGQPCDRLQGRATGIWETEPTGTTDLSALSACGLANSPSCRTVQNASLGGSRAEAIAQR